MSDLVAKSEPESGRLLTVLEAAAFLNVSESCVRRHVAELPILRIGRLVRIDAALLAGQFQEKLSAGKSLRPERKLMLSRFQRGYVYQTGRKVKTWYGRFREDVPQADGQIVRRSRNVRLGTLSELPTRTAARNKLADYLRNSDPSVEMNFRELSERWQVVAMPTLKLTTGTHYRNALRAYVVPAFGKRNISTIKRFDVETFLAQQSKKYSRSTLRSMRVSLSLVMSWAVACGWIDKNPCAGVKLPRDSNCGGRRVVRTILKLDQVTAIAEKLEEPYSTLVLFLAVTGLRIGEAIAITWSDFDGNVLSVSRRICDGDLDTVKSEGSNRKLPIPLEMVSRMRQLGDGEWIFRSREGTPVNPGNALKRYIRPAAKQLGIAIGGWHDFRHTLTTNMRRSGVHPKVISGILGHSGVTLAMNTYDHLEAEDFRLPLEHVSGELLLNVTKSGEAA
jgi:excisionase family DNA binding protein